MGQPRGRILGGCRLERRADARILIACEEAALVRDAAVRMLRPGETAIWDRRFLVTVAEAPGPLQLRPLGPEGVKAVGKAAALPPVEPSLIAATTPGLWRAGRLVAAPALGFRIGDVTVSARFVGLSRL